MSGDVLPQASAASRHGYRGTRSPGQVTGFGPVLVLLRALSFPFRRQGGSDLPSPAPPSPQPFPGAAGARSHGLCGRRDPKAGAGPAGGGGLTGRRPCPVPFPWGRCSQPLSRPRGPSCDSGFLEEVREGTEDSPSATRPGFPRCLPVPSLPCGYTWWA